MPAPSAASAHGVPHSRRSSAKLPGPLAVMANSAAVMTSGSS